MMVGLFVMVGLILILTWLQMHKLAMGLFVLNICFSLAVFLYHVTDKIPVNF